MCILLEINRVTIIISSCFLLASAKTTAALVTEAGIRLLARVQQRARECVCHRRHGDCIIRWATGKSSVRIFIGHFYGLIKKWSSELKLKIHSGNSGSCRSCGTDAGAALAFRTSRSCSEISKNHFSFFFRNAFGVQTEEFYSLDSRITALNFVRASFCRVFFVFSVLFVVSPADALQSPLNTVIVSASQPTSLRFNSEKIVYCNAIDSSICLKLENTTNLWNAHTFRLRVQLHTYCGLTLAHSAGID